MSTIVCTLVEGKHFLGVAALFNSLKACGYQGTLVVGYRGEVPAWFSQQSQAIGEGIEIDLIPMTLQGHMANLKPHWMLSIFKTYSNASCVAYVDPDVCFVAPWDLIEDWIGEGVAVAENCSLRLPAGHWRLRAWEAFFKPLGFAYTQPTDIYVNSGFVGVHKEAISLLKRWESLIDSWADSIGGYHITSLPGGNPSDRLSNRYDPFFETDQDLFNCVIRSGEESIHFVGQDGMGFLPGLALMTHALGDKKPWDRRFVLDALNGRKPSYADKTFFQCCDGPIRSYSPLLLMRKRFSLKIACFLRGRGWS